MPNVNSALKEKIKETVPRPWLHRAKTFYQQQKVERSGLQTAWADAGTDPAWLSTPDLEALVLEYPTLEAESQLADYYAPGTLLERGTRRRALLQRVLGSAYDAAHEFLETGGADGMVGYALAQSGKRATTVDIRSDDFEPRAREAGVRFIEANVSELDLPDGCMDVVYSFDAFEHYEGPEAALREAIRLTRPGGHIYLRFGPLYRSPDGMHLGSRLGVPYAPVLFQKHTIDDYLVERGRDPINHEHCNEWTLAQFRRLFSSVGDQLELIESYDHRDLSAVDLIRRFPSCFRGKCQDLDEFLVAILEVLFRKRA